MLDDANEVKSWLQNEERLERRVTLIELWEKGETEELKEKAGPYYEEFQEMMEVLQEEYSKDEITDSVMKSELESEGFETVVALRIVEALDTAEVGGDLTILKRKTTPEQQGKLMELAIMFRMGWIGRKELEEELTELEIEDSTSNLFQRTARFLRAAIKESITEMGGLAMIREGVSDRSGYDEKRTDEFLSPIEDNIQDLQDDYIRAEMIERGEKFRELNKKVDQIMKILMEKE